MGTDKPTPSANSAPPAHGYHPQSNQLRLVAPGRSRLGGRGCPGDPGRSSGGDHGRSPLQRVGAGASAAGGGVRVRVDRRRRLAGRLYRPAASSGQVRQAVGAVQDRRRRRRRRGRGRASHRRQRIRAGVDVRASRSAWRRAVARRSALRGRSRGDLPRTGWRCPRRGPRSTRIGGAVDEFAASVATVTGAYYLTTAATRSSERVHSAVGSGRGRRWPPRAGADPGVRTAGTRPRRRRSAPRAPRSGGPPAGRRRRPTGRAARRPAAAPAAVGVDDVRVRTSTPRCPAARGRSATGTGHRTRRGSRTPQDQGEQDHQRRDAEDGARRGGRTHGSIAAYPRAARRPVAVELSRPLADGIPPSHDRARLPLV